MSMERNEAVVRRLFEEGWNRGKLEALDELVSADAVPAHGAGVPGPESWKQAIQLYRGSFADLHYIIEDLFGTGDKIAVRWSATGRDTIGFMGMKPTGRSATVTGMSIYRLKDGKLVEHWDEFDMAGLLQTLGALPSMPPLPH